MEVVLVTCEAWPELSVSDAALATELADRGHRVWSRPWNGTPVAEFAAADLVVLRSNWDYHYDLAAFDSWVQQVDLSDAVLHNPAALVRSHLDKLYLEDLSTDGFRTPRTLRTHDFDVRSLMEWIEEHDLERVVAKPAWGASGESVELIEPSDLEAARRRWLAKPSRRPMLMQEFVPEVQAGECSLVFFNSEFSHALIRRPPPGEFRVNSQFGGSMSLLDHVSPEMVEFAAKVEATLPEVATYARIDVVDTGSGFVVMEVELNEPALGLHLAPGSAARFADALVGS